MPKLTQVKISDLVSASARYAEAEVKKADLNANGYVSRTEAKKLAPDLQDNFAASGFKKSWGSVTGADLTREFKVMMEAFARSSDKNGDGYLSATEAKALPQSLRDNFANYLAVQQGSVVVAGGYTTSDLTTQARVQEHLDAHGPSPISYQDAFARALKAVATDEYGLPMFVREFGGPDGAGVTEPAKIDAEVRALLKNGEVELVPVDEEIPTGERTADAWIFSVHTDGQGDHGLWAIVDRQTGETTVTSFN